MGFADGFYYGQGKIIIDTTGVAVDTVYRVRSVTQPTKMWHVTVVTSGTPLVVEVPGKDYYKICLLEDVGGTPTESTAIYRTIDYGQTIFAEVLDKTTLGGIQGILNAHLETDLLNVGDQVNITVDGNSWTMLIGGINIYNSHEVIFVSRDIYNKYSWVNVGRRAYYSQGPLRTQCQNFFNLISESDKKYIKDKIITSSVSSGYSVCTDKVWLPTVKEVSISDYISGLSIASEELSENKQIPIFTTVQQRCKSYNGNATTWFTASQPYNSDYVRYWSILKVDGTYQVTQGSTSGSTDTLESGIVPCFHLTADV